MTMMAASVWVLTYSLTLQDSWHLPPPSLPLAGQTLVNRASETTPPCLLFLPLPVVSPQAPPLHSLLTRWSTHRNRAQLSQHYNPCQNLTPRRSAFKTYSGLVSQCSLHVDRTALTCRAGVGWRVGGGGGQVGQNWGWLQCPILI